MIILKLILILINCLKGCYKFLSEKLIIIIDFLVKIGVFKKMMVIYRLNLFSNMVIVKKKNFSNLRLCIDFIDLNFVII